MLVMYTKGTVDPSYLSFLTSHRLLSSIARHLLSVHDFLLKSTGKIVVNSVAIARIIDTPSRLVLNTRLHDGGGLQAILSDP
jgi:hypothetical protein